MNTQFLLLMGKTARPSIGTEDGKLQLGERVHLAGDALVRIEQKWNSVFNNQQANLFGHARAKALGGLHG